MPLSADALAERARLKRETRRWRVFAFVSLCGAALLFLPSREKGLVVPGTDYIARVSVEGFIGDDLKRDEMLSEIAEDTHAKALLVRFDSPGGTALGGEELYRQISAIAKQKPVVAIMRTACTSACYMAALGSSQLIARDSSITGSVGVLLEMAEFSELAKKIGVEPISIKSGKEKATPSMLEKMDNNTRDYIQNVVDDSFAMFLGIVTQHRKLTPETLALVREGRVFTGSQAKHAGLIDGLGGQKEALVWLETSAKLRKKLPVRDVEPKKEPRDWIAALEQSARHLILGGITQRLDGLLAIWQPSVK